MEDTEMDIILSAVDNASDTFESVQSAAEGMGDTMQESAEQGTDGMEQRVVVKAWMRWNPVPKPQQTH